jgi:hypothetical protein
MDIHKLTMEIMGNQNIIKRTHCANKSMNQIKEDEYCFYKDRITELIEELLKQDVDFNSKICKDVSTSFNTFVENCIKYFKLIDTNDLLQSEYTESFSCVKTEEEKEKEAMEELELLGLDNISYENANKAIMKKVKCDMNNFIKRTKTQKPSYYFPKQKEINLQSDVLKNKSIHTVINTPLVMNDVEQCELNGENTYVLINELDNNLTDNATNFDDILAMSSPPYICPLGDSFCNNNDDTSNREDIQDEPPTETEKTNENIIPINIIENIVMEMVKDTMLQTVQELKDKEPINETFPQEQSDTITQPKSGKKKNKKRGKKQQTHEPNTSLQLNI